MAVVFYHAGIPGFTGGFVGVDVFFVISGYLITGIIWAGAQDGSFSLQEFYVRRIKRLFPALFAMLLVSSVAAFVLLIPADLEKFGTLLNSTILFYSNFQLVKLDNYFAAPAVENPLLHTWSLSVEEQFYAVWPVILLLLTRIAPAKRLPQIIVFLAAVSLVLAEARLPDYQKDAFYLPWCRGWEFFLGAGLALYTRVPRHSWISTGMGIARIAAIVAAVTIYDTSTRFPGWTALLPCGGAALIIFAAKGENIRRPRPLIRPPPARRAMLLLSVSYSLAAVQFCASLSGRGTVPTLASPACRHKLRAGPSLVALY